MYKNFFIAVFIIITIKKIQSLCLSIDEGIKKKKLCIQKMEYYWTVKNIKYKYVQRHGWTLKIYCWVKEVRGKRPYTVWFYLYGKSRIGKLLLILGINVY